MLVLATGFQADAFMRPMRVTGRGGTTLEQAWTPRPNAYLSISIPEFPNFFMLNGPNGPVGNFSLIEVAELQFGYIMQLVDLLRDETCREISANPDAMERVRGRSHRRRAEDGLGHRLPELVPRRPGHPAAWPWSFDRFRAEMTSPTRPPTSSSDPRARRTLRARSPSSPAADRPRATRVVGHPGARVGHGREARRHRGQRGWLHQSRVVGPRARDADGRGESGVTEDLGEQRELAPTLPEVVGVVQLDGGWAVSRSEGVKPSGALLPPKQFCEPPPNKVIRPKSPLVGLP